MNKIHIELEEAFWLEWETAQLSIFSGIFRSKGNLEDMLTMIPVDEITATIEPSQNGRFIEIKHEGELIATVREMPQNDEVKPSSEIVNRAPYRF